VAKKKRELPIAAATSVADPDRNWADDPDSKAYKDAAELYDVVEKAFQNKEEQADKIEEYWAIYNAEPDDNQMYAGNTQGYIPAVRDAINARTKRCLRQLFPSNGKHVDGLGADGKIPYPQLALIEHYIRKTNLKNIVRTDLIAGDVTGQWNLMLDWTTSARSVTNLVKKNPVVEMIDGEDATELGLSDPTDEYDDTEDQEIVEEGPEVVDFATEDIAVIPPTCTDLQKARAVAIRLRMSRDKVEEMVEQGVFILPENTELKQFCEPDKGRDKRPPPKRQVSGVGIKEQGTNKYALIYLVYTKLDLGGDFKQEAMVYYGTPRVPCGIIRNPLWSGKRPILSKPVDRAQGSFFGRSKIEPVKFLQWNLTDFWNMGQDSALYSLNPIWAVDPVSTPQWQTLVMGLAAVWPVDPAKVKPITQPQLWKDAVSICNEMKRQIWESMDVNEMMMGKMPQGRKNNQLMGSMQQEQSTNIVDHAMRYEEEMLNPLVEMLFEFDQQFRTDEIVIEQRGPLGTRAAFSPIPPQQWGERYTFSWQGTEFQQSMQRQQQAIAWMNVLKGIPPQQMNGRRLDVTPILEAGTEMMFGPELAPRILVDEREMYTVPADVEDEMMWNGWDVEVHPSDNDIEHLRTHMRAATQSSDPHGLFKKHMQEHAQAIIKKRQANQQPQLPPPGQPGVPGAPGGAGPGQAGAPGGPRPGAMPGMPRGGQNPPGAIHPDAMAGMPGRG